MRGPAVPASHSTLSESPTPTSSAPYVSPAGHGKAWPKVGNPATQVAAPCRPAVMRPICWSLRLPEGQVSALLVAGARETKTSNWPVAETVAVESEERSKRKLQVLPLVSGGKSKVRRVVTSVLRPFLNTLPLISSRRTAPVQTSY